MRAYIYFAVATVIAGCDSEVEISFDRSAAAEISGFELRECGEEMTANFALRALPEGYVEPGFYLEGMREKLRAGENFKDTNIRFESASLFATNESGADLRCEDAACPEGFLCESLEAGEYYYEPGKYCKRDVSIAVKGHPSFEGNAALSHAYAFVQDNSGKLSESDPLYRRKYWLRHFVSSLSLRESARFWLTYTPGGYEAFVNVFKDFVSFRGMTDAVENRYPTPSGKAQFWRAASEITDRLNNLKANHRKNAIIFAYTENDAGGVEDVVNAMINNPGTTLYYIDAHKERVCERCIETARATCGSYFRVEDEHGVKEIARSLSDLSLSRWRVPIAITTEEEVGGSYRLAFTMKVSLDGHENVYRAQRLFEQDLGVRDYRLWRHRK